MAQQPNEYRRGEVYTSRMPGTGGKSQPLMAALISRDDWNQNPPDGRVWAAPIRRVPRPLAVKCSSADPVSGWVQIHAHGMIPRDWLMEPVGMLVGDTLQRIDEALDTLRENLGPNLDQ